MTIETGGYLRHLLGDLDFKRVLEACDKLLANKGADYTAGNSNRLWNFDSAAEFLHQTPFAVLGVYLHKHMTAIYAFLGHGKVESEPIEGRIHDAINYLLLLAKMIERERQKELIEPPKEVLELMRQLVDPKEP